MNNLSPGKKKAGLVGLGHRGPAVIRQSLNYQFLRYLSSPKNSNHKFFLTQGRRVFQRPANWNVRLRH